MVTWREARDRYNMNITASEYPAMTDFPRSLLEFQRRVPDEAACAGYLRQLRWPEGLILPP